MFFKYIKVLRKVSDVDNTSTNIINTEKSKWAYHHYREDF